MKKLILVASVTAAISLVNTANAATSGTVNFSGKLNDQTCQVVLNNGSASGTVTLPTVPKERLPEKFSETGKTVFTLKVTGCKAGSTAFGILAYFPPTAYIEKMDNYYSFLKNLETGVTAAQGVYLTIYQTFGTSEKEIRLGEPVTDESYRYTTVDAGATSTTLRYSVSYIRWDTAVTPGKVKGMAVYELAYQ